MIYGKGAFVTPSDSVAIIAHWADVIPYFKRMVLRDWLAVCLQVKLSTLSRKRRDWNTLRFLPVRQFLNTHSRLR